MKISVLSLVFLPVTWGYAIVRYRLMDVDIIFKRGVAYTLATAAIVVAYFVGIGSLAGSITTKFPGTGTWLDRGHHYYRPDFRAAQELDSGPG